MLKSDSHFFGPGIEPLKKTEGRSSKAHNDIFQKPKLGGGGAPKKKVEAIAEPEVELLPEKAEPPPTKEYPVKLTDPKWLSEKGYYEEKIQFSVNVDLPKSHADFTRVSVVLSSLGPNGKKTQVNSIDVHTRDGKAQGEFKVQRPPNSKPSESSFFVFAASHRDCGKEVESSKLEVNESPRSLVLELDDHSDISRHGYSLVMKGVDGTIHSRLKADDGVDADGIFTFEFKGLTADVAYVLELHNDKDEMVTEIFSGKKHGQWEPKP